MCKGGDEEGQVEAVIEPGKELTNNRKSFYRNINQKKEVKGVPPDKK